MGTVVAPAAQAILDQATTHRPNRSTLSDGTIGDAAHRARVSDHNPDGRGIVHAADLTHDPASGMDAHGWARWLAERRDPRVKYIISNRRIWQPATGWSGYGGANPHTAHVHVSIRSGSRWENDVSSWFAGFLSPPGYVAPTTPAPAPPITRPVPPAAAHIPFPLEDDDMKAHLVQCEQVVPGVWLAFGNTRTGVRDLADLAETQDYLRIQGCPDQVQQIKPGAMRTLHPLN